MVQRIALFFASLAAVAVIVVGLAAAGVTPSLGSPAAIASTVAPPDPAPTPQVDTIYVAPPQVPQTVVVHKTVPAAGGGENESEGAGG
jgi:hypothetical protein